MPVLRQGSSGATVKDLQQRLTDLGFDPRGIDGVFGPGTTAAVIAFQQSKGLQGDGIVGPATMSALQTATGADAPAGGGTGTDAGAPAGGANDGSSTAPVSAPGLNLAGLAGRIPDTVIAQIPDAAKDFCITSNLRL